MSKLRNYFFVLSGLLAMSCTEKLDDKPGFAGEGQEAMVSISINTVPEVTGIPGSRAIDSEVDEGIADTYKVRDFWLLEYNGVGKLLGAPRYFRMDDFEDGEVALPIILPSDGDTYKCVLIANTHAPALISVLDKATTLEALMAIHKPIHKQDDLYQAVSEGGNADLLMNGIADVTAGIQRLDVQLYRNVAKLTVQLSNESVSGVKITSVQLRNVPDHLFYADQLHRDIPAPNPTLDESGIIDLPLEPCGLEPGNSEDIVYYMTRNCRGENGSTEVTQKNVDAPDYATYLEIMAEDMETNTPMRYRFYLGENMVNNFDIKPNYHYTLPIKIAHKGDAKSDSRVEDLGSIRLGDANSFIINPVKGSAQTVYACPIMRINAFWCSEGMGNDHSTEIVQDSKWVAEVIWQDQDKRMINFCDATGRFTQDNTTYSGVGVSSFYFRPVDGAEGNVLIGVRKQGSPEREYLWSWHLWITDYNPNAHTTSWRDNIYSYAVDGGAVHHYTGGIWDTYYNNMYIMDRNLGAKSAERADGEAAIGLFYQFGRKDPFPTQKQLYDINGNPVSSSGGGIETVPGSTFFYIAVQRPYAFYNASTGDWAVENPYATHLWNNPSWYYDDLEDPRVKSFFDPCPEGWKIPLIDTWDGFRGNQEKLNVVGFPNAYMYNTPTAGWDFYMGGFHLGETAFYHTTSQYRGAYVNDNTLGYYWSSTVANAQSGRTFKFTSANASYAGEHRFAGQNIRCVQEGNLR